MLGVGPYITGSIIMQLLTIMVPSLKRIYQEEGEAGRKRFAQYGRLLTVPLAAIQGFSLLYILEKENILIDGAHNPNGTKALRESLDYYFPNQNFKFRLVIRSYVDSKRY